jgi:hypothetical protein
MWVCEPATRNAKSSVATPTSSSVYPVSRSLALMSNVKRLQFFESVWFWYSRAVFMAAVSRRAFRLASMSRTQGKEGPYLTNNGFSDGMVRTKQDRRMC